MTTARKMAAFPSGRIRTEGHTHRASICFIERLLVMAMYLLLECSYCISEKDICQRGKHYRFLYSVFSFFVHNVQMYTKVSLPAEGNPQREDFQSPLSATAFQIPETLQTHQAARHLFLRHRAAYSYDFRDRCFPALYSASITALHTLRTLLRMGTQVWLP